MKSPWRQKLKDTRKISERFAFKDIPLHLVLTVPFLILIFSSVGITSYLSLRNERKAIQNLAIKLTDEVADDIKFHFTTYLKKTQEVHQTIIASIQSQIIDLEDFETLEKYFWYQTQTELIPDIFFANPQGEIIGIRKLVDNSEILRIKDASTESKRQKYLLDHQGNRLQLIKKEEYDTKSRPWYRDALIAREQTWTNIYSSTNLLVPEISLVSPIYHPKGELKGIIGSELTLWEFNRFLEKLEMDNSGVAFLIEKNGGLVASSTSEPIFAIVDGTETRVLAQNSANPLIRSTARYLFNQFNNLQSIKNSQNFQIKIDGENNIAQINPILDIKGIEFLIVVIIPESNFMTEINKNKQASIILCFLFLSVATLLGLMTSSWITSSVRHLSNASIAITNGNLDHKVEIKTIRELSILSMYFNQMTEQLKKSFAALEKSNQKLESRTILLHKTKIAAEAANKAKSQFLATMSHELRTPLNAILGFTQLMNRDSNLTSKQRDNLQIINRSGEHLLSLINDVLSISKIESGHITLNSTSFDLYRLIDTVYTIFKPMTESKGIELKLECSAELPNYIKTDEKKLRQVLLNLLSNAIKFTKVGTVTLRMSAINIQEKLINLNCEIEDTGDGIAAEELDNLFKPFSQTSTGQKLQQGTGLGLVISQKFIELMGGVITMKSIVGQGTIAKFNCVVEPSSQDTTSNAIFCRKVIGLQPNSVKYRILVVDDRYENRQLLVQLLESVGFEVSEATNGQEAISVWSSWQPHLIWMDMQMPVLDGYQATRIIRSHAQGQTTKIIALTASAFEEKRELVMSVGCDDFVHKPFQESIIWEKMAKYLDVSYLYEENPLSIKSSTDQTFRLEVVDLNIMPIEWIAKLEKAALELDEELITELLQQIPDEHTLLLKTLQERLNNFDFGHILDLAKKVHVT